ncbi:hypothetical protein A2U01_0056569, partial [Trifolium medium]|nr:hypothetical protein [Trifolium medium]
MAWPSALLRLPVLPAVVTGGSWWCISGYVLSVLSSSALDGGRSSVLSSWLPTFVSDGNRFGGFMVFGSEKALVHFLPALCFGVLAATVLSLDRAMDGGFFS